MACGGRVGDIGQSGRLGRDARRNLPASLPVAPTIPRDAPASATLQRQGGVSVRRRHVYARTCAAVDPWSPLHGAMVLPSDEGVNPGRWVLYPDALPEATRRAYGLTWACGPDD
jgi:hypothetical protein